MLEGKSAVPTTQQSVVIFTLAVVSLCGPVHVRTSQQEGTGTDSERSLVLEALKSGILSSLGMDKPPVVHKKATQTELRKMQQLYQERLSELGLNASRSNWESTQISPSTVQKLRPGQSSDSHGRRIHWHRVEFVEKPRIQDELSLIRAELHMSRQVLERAARKVKVHVRNSRRTRRAEWADGGGNASQSAVLDVSEEVRMWIEGSGRSLEVDVGSRGADYEFDVALELTHERRARTTRSVKADGCDEGGLCCRQSVTVSFKDIGWTDWVVAPLEYTMHFCQGSCPHNYRPASMHTQVKSRMAQISKGGTPRPCCVPSEYEPMVLMHYDSRGKLKLTPFEDLVVSQCYCA